MSADGTPRAPTGSSAPAPTLESYRPPSSGAQSTPIPVTAARRRFFNQIITQCVLTLLMIETVNELFSNDTVYAQIPAPELLRLMALLKKSYHFARRFNSDLELRTRLFREGFMRQPPNLLKQESGAAATYVAILLRMHHDGDPARAGSRAATTEALVPLCADILRAYLELDDGEPATPTLGGGGGGGAAAAGGTQARNMAVWRPVVVDVLEGYAGFAREEFREHVPVFAPLVVGLLGRELASSPELQVALQRVVARVIEVSAGVECGAYLVPWERGGRRASRGR
jgi:brefeldin A-inhibited guanine nucleotide-exchange protein